MSTEEIAIVTEALLTWAPEGGRRHGEPVRFREFVDERGTLLPIEFSHVPFPVRRVFIVHGNAEGRERGQHHAGSDQLLVLVAGSVVVRHGREVDALAETHLTEAGATLLLSPDDYVSDTLRDERIEPAGHLVGGVRGPWDGEHMTGTVRASVLIPTHSHFATLPMTVRSALAQNMADLEVLIIGDGVDEATRDAAEALQRGDQRVRFLDLPKGDHHGEAHRHTAICEARSEVIAYLCDDDLLLPDHVGDMVELLQDHDFCAVAQRLGHVFGADEALPDGSLAARGD